MEIHALPPEQLGHFIERVRKFGIDRYEAYLHSLITNIISELEEFIPSDGAMVLIDNPAHKSHSVQENELVYIASCGPKSKEVLGKKIPVSGGLIGETYTLGKSMVRKSDSKEKMVIDRVNFPHPVNSLTAVPLKIENTVIGVLVIYNKKDPIGYTIRDLKLAEIFAGYFSTSLQNAIDAKKSQELSKRDDLTGLYNDRHFHKQLEAEILKSEAAHQPLSLLFMDLDNFKSINDQYGHLVGSLTLKEVSFILRDSVPQTNATMARYGGDEYVLILPGTSLDQATLLAEAIRKGVQEKMYMIDRGEQDGSFVNFKGILTTSIGIASYHDHVVQTGTLREKKNLFIRKADQAMYKAKELGKNRVELAV